MKLSIIIPVFNEMRTLPIVLRKVDSTPLAISREVIVVDDGSTDGGRELLLKLSGDPALLNLRSELKVLFHERNRGKGAAIRTALKQVSGDIVLIQDADLEYDPQEYSHLLAPILDGRADVVYGSRLSAASTHRVLYYWHYLGNTALTTLSNMLTNLNLSDMEVGYKVFRADILKSLKLKSDRFGFEPEVTVKVAKTGCRVYEAPISYYGRTYEDGKKITWKDGVAAIFFLVRYRMMD